MQFMDSAKKIPQKREAFCTKLAKVEICED